MARWSLTPASRDEFRRELTACLALVAPAGMDEGARREWLTIAWGTLDGIPSDLLSRGCLVARRKCDHPSKIVPTIMAEVGEAWERRRDRMREDYAAPTPQLPEPERCTPEQAAKIMQEFGLRRNPLETISNSEHQRAGVG